MKCVEYCCMMHAKLFPEVYKNGRAYHLYTKQVKCKKIKNQSIVMENNEAMSFHVPLQKGSTYDNLRIIMKALLRAHDV